jgi:hypothetical protein
MHPRPQRSAARSAPAYRRGASHAPGVGRAGAMAGAQHDHRTALWPDQTTRRLPALDGVGIGRREDPMVAAVRHINSAGTLCPLAVESRTRSAEPASAGNPVGKGTEVRRSTAPPRRAVGRALIPPGIGPELPPANLALTGLRSSALKYLLRQIHSVRAAVCLRGYGRRARSDAPYYVLDPGKQITSLGGA